MLETPLVGHSCCHLFVTPVLLQAQFETASGLGYVRDASGTFIPRATVTLVNTAIKTQTSVQTDGQGSYQFTDVKVGQYQVTAKAAGFDPASTPTFSVTVNALFQSLKPFT